MAIAYLALAWLLIEVADTLFPAFGIPDWAFRFVATLLALGFIPVLIYSWAYEITPEGLKRERDVVRDAAIDAGWRQDSWYHLNHDPALTTLQDNPAFRAMKQEIAADLEAQLARVREWEANGGLPPVPGGTP